RPDEIGDLARAFERLSATVTDLSVKVIDKGRELEWTRRELALKESLSLLFEVTQEPHGENDLLVALPGRVCAALGLAEMAVLLQEGAELVVRAQHGLGDGALGATFPRDLAQGAPLRSATGDARREPSGAPRGPHASDGAFACVPMRVHGRLVGVVTARRHGPAPISDADQQLLGSIASYAAL